MGEPNHHSELSFCELRAKEIVNSYDGRRLGRIVDIIFSDCGGEVLGIVVPYCRRVFFTRNQEVFIPWRCICKIGEDVILVDIGEGLPGVGNNRRRRIDARGRGHDFRYDGCFDDCHGDGYKKNDCCCEPKHDDCCYTKHGDCGGGRHGDCADEPHCDRKCEKCMLFDCAYRWKNV